MKHLSKYLIGSVGILVVGSLIYFSQKTDETTNTLSLDPAVVAMSPSVSLEQAYPFLISPKSTLSSALQEHNVEPATIHEIVEAAKPIYNLARILPGTRFQLTYDTIDNTDLTGVKFRFSAVDMLDLKKLDGTWHAEKITEKVDIKTVTFAGTVTSSLWESAESAKMDPNLISELSEIFAWQVDFARAVRINDRWRLSVEQKFVRGEPVGWGSILAAEYENAGELYQAALFRVDGESRGYFALDGTSLRRMFLKSPLRFGRISSRFNRKRFHPVLGINRPHLGVDYAAPIGTPVHAVGDGVVTFAATAGGGGKVVKLRHNSTYQTAYKHLSGYAKGVRTGSRVRQGQIIAYVGNTGLSTGPHLHFEFYQSGVFVDPLGKKFPSAEPVPKEMLAQFKADAAPLLATLPAWQVASVDASSKRTTASDSATRE